MDYKKQYSNPQWQKKRLEIMQRDNFACEACGDTEEMLNVHHKHYIKGKKIWEYDDENLITLCEICHKSIKELLDEIKYHVANIIDVDSLFYLSKIIKYHPTPDILLDWMNSRLRENKITLCKKHHNEIPLT